MVGFLLGLQFAGLQARFCLGVFFVEALDLLNGSAISLYCISDNLIKPFNFLHRVLQTPL
jgi:hypothetical protein